MVKWSRLKLALLAASAVVLSAPLSGCLGNDWYGRLIQYVAIGNLFD